jgi:hypothetical protein
MLRQWFGSVKNSVLRELFSLLEDVRPGRPES